MNIADLPKWLAGNRPLAAKVAAVLSGGREQSIALGANSNRWSRVANTLQSMSAEAVRLYNNENEVVGSMDIDYDAPGRSAADEARRAASPPATEPVNLSILKDASDVNALVHALAQAFATVVTNVSVSQSEAHKMAFHELREVNKIQGELIKSLRRQAEDAIDAREEAVQVREQEHEEKKNGDAMMGKLIDLAGPEIIKKVGEKIFAAPATPPAVTNGAPVAKE